MSGKFEKAYRKVLRTDARGMFEVFYSLPFLARIVIAWRIVRGRRKEKTIAHVELNKPWPRR